MLSLIFLPRGPKVPLGTFEGSLVPLESTLGHRWRREGRVKRCINFIFLLLLPRLFPERCLLTGIDSQRNVSSSAAWVFANHARKNE